MKYKVIKTTCSVLLTLIMGISMATSALAQEDFQDEMVVDESELDNLITDISEEQEEEQQEQVTPTVVNDFKPIEKVNRDLSGTFADGVWIGPIDLSDMTYEDARKSIAVYVSTMLDSKVTLQFGEEHSCDISAGELGLKWDDEETLYDALCLCRSGNIVMRYKQMKDIERETKSYDLKLSFDEQKLNDIVHKLGERYNVTPQEATMVREDEEFVITEGQTGFTLDEAASVKEIQNQLRDWKGEDITIALAVKVEEPKAQKEDLMQVRDLLGSFTTNFYSSGEDRSGNLRNGAALINGTILYPGEEFSTYETVSPFTKENGYFLAGSYYSGQVVESFGGGICQVSTTLYNAVLLSELEVTERYNHSRKVSYVKLSADAAIAGTEKDFKFKNNTDYPIYIEGIASKNKKLTFNIYGVETRPDNRTVELESVEVKTEEPGETVVEDPTKPTGYTSASGGRVGYYGEYWRIIKVDGEEVSREMVNKSHYLSQPRTIVVGTGPVELAIPTPAEMAPVE